MAAFALKGRIGVEEEAEAPPVCAAHPIASLVRLVFFPATAAPRKRILFCAAGSETNLLNITKSAGEELAKIMRVEVAIVARPPELPSAAARHGRRFHAPDFWPGKATQLGERLWLLPTETLSSAPDEVCTAGPLSDHLPFEYVLYAASVTDSVFPLVCSHCEAAVLVITANRTRREAVLQAKRLLQQCNIKLLGAVLQDRKFPIPESIYRRL